ncbi:hypothetical protein DUI87_14339 [Hirundo rustica rustica]|uniref:Uncharacterized protein n=1 Tax=Hirundo rustica rustica TaxID=333673 RepID=A0A3M0K9W5_HIRRU|nr:hypothetical protein DUI87_14339 [Hirundo rustica rustica]
MESAEAPLEERIGPDPAPGMRQAQLRVPTIPGLRVSLTFPRLHRGTLAEELPGTLPSSGIGVRERQDLLQRSIQTPAEVHSRAR